jgi:signal transduction histidine kinase
MSDLEFRGLAEEQAALRRVAVLVAGGATPEEMFAAVAEEVGRLLPVDEVGMGSYEPDGTITFIASWSSGGNAFQTGTQFSLGGNNLPTLVYENKGDFRIDHYDGSTPGPLGDLRRGRRVRSGVAAPIMVDGHLWGMIGAGSNREEPLPAETQLRLASFVELLEAVIANAEGRAEMARLAEEQAALRRVATLVAEETPPEEVFAAVNEEVGHLLSVDVTNLSRYEPDGSMTFVATWESGDQPSRFPVGTRTPLGGHNLSTLVYESGRQARIDDYQDAASGSLGDIYRDRNVQSAVGVPIMAEGILWGMMAIASTGSQPLPPDTESRLASFTELVAMAIANAESRAQLTASRARIAAAADQTRRRFERDLHDGIQQQLVSLLLNLQTAESDGPCENCGLSGLVERTAQSLVGALDALQEISRGLHPAILSKAGLGSAFKALARRSAVPVELDVRSQRRLPEHIEVAIYYVVAEALANAAKHAHASVVAIELDVQETTLSLAIRDNGVGSADPNRGSGLVGLTDRVEALDGRLEIVSPVGQGTALLIEVPVNV